MADSGTDAALRDWLAAALRSGRPPPLAPDVDAPSLLQAAEQEGVVALLEARLRDAGGWGALLPEQQQALAQASRAQAAAWLLRAQELKRIESVLAAAKLRALLLKGSALAQWLYPQPYLRMGGDIDLLLDSGSAVEQAAHALSALGYAPVFAPGDTHYEWTLRSAGEGAACTELDLHSRLLNAAAFAEIFAFDELWKAAPTRAKDGDAVRALAPMHALAHACLNRALDLQNGIPDRLKLLYDLRLLTARFTPDDWEAFCRLAGQKRVAGVCLRSLEDAAHALGADVPDATRARLARLAAAEPLDHRRLDDWRYMQWQNLKALPTWGARLHWLRQRLLPPAAQLRALYGEAPLWRLWLRRLRRGVSRLQGAKAP